MEKRKNFGSKSGNKTKTLPPGQYLFPDGRRRKKEFKQKILFCRYRG